MWRDAVHEALLTHGPAVVLLLGPGGSGKTRFWERDLPARGWNPTSHEDVDSLALGAWLARAGSTTFGFCAGQHGPMAVVDDVDALSAADRGALLLFVRERVAQHRAADFKRPRPVLLVGRTACRDLSRLLTGQGATVRAVSPTVVQAATLLGPSYPRLSPAAVLSCCRMAAGMDADMDADMDLHVDLHNACALMAAESVAPGLGRQAGRTVGRARDAAGCPDAALLFAPNDAFDPGVLEARVGGDASTAFSLAFENVDAVLARVFAAGSRRRERRDRFIQALASVEPFTTNVRLRPFLDAVLVSMLRACLGDLPRRVRKADGAPPWARAALWSRGACAAQASQRRQVAASTKMK